MGEGHFREFKSAFDGPPSDKRNGNVKTLCGYIGEALVAFANADGGELLVGVEDNGSVTGVPHYEDGIASMLSAYQTHVHKDNKLHVTFNLEIRIDDKIVLLFSVEKGTTAIYIVALCKRYSTLASTL